jgi:CRP-like cAMP-binding protein
MFGHPSHTATQFLQAQPWFASLTADAQARLLQSTSTVSARKGSVLLPAHETVQGWYAVLSGLVKLQSQPAKGRISAFLGIPAGEWFGEGSALKHERRRYEVVTLRDTELMCLPSAVFDELQAHSLEFNRFLVMHMNRRLSQAMAAIEADRTRSPEHRVALYLSRLFWPGQRRLNLSQEELGHLAGMSRQTVNRALSALQQQQLVTLTAGRIGVLDEAALSRLLLATEPSQP